MLRDIFDVCTIKTWQKRGGNGQERQDIGMITIAGPSGKEFAKPFLQPQDVLQEMKSMFCS